MTSPHPLAAWVARNQTDERRREPDRIPAQRFAPDDEEDDDLDERRRRARSLSRRRARTAATVSRVRYS